MLNTGVIRDSYDIEFHETLLMRFRWPIRGQVKEEQPLVGNMANCGGHQKVYNKEITIISTTLQLFYKTHISYISYVFIIPIR